MKSFKFLAPTIVGYIQGIYSLEIADLLADYDTSNLSCILQKNAGKGIPVVITTLPKGNKYYPAGIAEVSLKETSAIVL